MLDAYSGRQMRELKASALSTAAGSHAPEKIGEMFRDPSEAPVIDLSRKWWGETA